MKTLKNESVNGLINKLVKGVFIGLVSTAIFACSTIKVTSVADNNADEQLLREHYVSSINNTAREYFVYLPKDYGVDPNKKWPTLLFLHGNGERGNGQDELDFVLTHGPLYEAWVQKKDLPFIIIAPQLPMFGWDKKGIGYIDNRSKENIPQRLNTGVPPRPKGFRSAAKIKRNTSLSDMSEIAPLLPQGWDMIESDLINILDDVEAKYVTDKARRYLSGLSYGGFGTWYLVLGESLP